MGKKELRHRDVSITTTQTMTKCYRSVNTLASQDHVVFNKTPNMISIDLWSYVLMSCDKYTKESETYR